MRDDRRGVHDRHREEVRGAAELALEDPAPGEVVADGDDEAGRRHVSSAARAQLVVGAEHGVAGDHVAARERAVEHADHGVVARARRSASITCRPWSAPPITMTLGLHAGVPPERLHGRVAGALTP